MRTRTLVAWMAVVLGVMGALRALASRIAAGRTSLGPVPAEELGVLQGAAVDASRFVLRWWIFLVMGALVACFALLKLRDRRRSGGDAPVE